jgi:hypothetical protein
VTVFRPIGCARRVCEFFWPALKRERERALNAEIRRLVCDAPREPVIVLME